MSYDNRNTKRDRHDRDPMEDLVANAVDFLERATKEFDKRPKHSVIAFHSAVELFLKARLMEEHWSLVVSKNADLASFKAGDFVSVSFEEACDRLRKIVDSPVTEGARKRFDRVRRHRNKLVHFYQDTNDPAVLEQIAVEQLGAWHALRGLLEGQWGGVFARFDIDIGSLNRRFSGHRLYLKTRFESLADKLDALVKEGKTIDSCQHCSYVAAERRTLLCELQEALCHVCGNSPRWLQLECANCGEEFNASGGEPASCKACGTEFDEAEISEQIDDDPVTYDNYYYLNTPANCSSCDGYETVLSFHDKYLCTACLELTDDISTCGWCHTGNNGDMTGSDWRGCNFCDGRSGWDRD